MCLMGLELDIGGGMGRQALFLGGDARFSCSGPRAGMEGTSSAALAQYFLLAVPRARQRSPHTQLLSPLQPCAPPRGPHQAVQQPSSCKPCEDGAIVRAQERFGGVKSSAGDVMVASVGYLQPWSRLCAAHLSL